MSGHQSFRPRDPARPGDLFGDPDRVTVLDGLNQLCGWIAFSYQIAMLSVKGCMVLSIRTLHFLI